MRVPLLCALPFLVAACVTGGSGGSPSFAPVGERSAHEDLSDARRMYDEGQYHVAVNRLQRLLAREPAIATEAEARYLLGLAYARIDAYKDAIEELEESVLLDPSGSHVAEAIETVAGLRVEYERRYPSAENIGEREKALRSRLISSPGDPTLLRALAELLWRQAKYDESAALYVDVATRDPSFKRDPIFMRRVELRADGQYVVLTPDEQTRREIAQRPLYVINTSTFRANPDRRTQIPRAFVVSGQVINRSNRTVIGATVNVTLFAFGGQVYDTGSRTVEVLRAGEIRAFSMRFNNFDNIDNIDRYECVASFRGFQ